MPTSVNAVRLLVFGVLVLLTAVYFFYQGWDVLFAPRLFVFTPEDGDSLNTTRVEVAGQTEPDGLVWVMGREIRADEDGNFTGILTLYPGYNAIGVKVSDDFGNETSKVIRVVVE